MRFIFDTIRHYLLFETKNESGEQFSARNVGKMLTKMLNSNEIVAEFGEVNVTIIPDEDTIQKILKTNTLKRLDMRVDRPNPDDLDQEEEELYQDMRNQRVNRIERSYVREKNAKTIIPSEATRTLARLAARNGYVTARYVERGKVKEESTKKHPRKQYVEYNGKVESPFQAFVRVAIEERES